MTTIYRNVRDRCKSKGETMGRSVSSTKRDPVNQQLVHGHRLAARRMRKWKTGVLEERREH